jgi:precorrin-6A/cobalt-precorrin-6A reductase
MRVLILGGTAEARALARALAPHAEVVSSLAGRVREPRLPAGGVRVGGFGGAEGLRDWLRASEIDKIVDATHPFAARMTATAAAVAHELELPIVRLQRPAWQPQPGDNWVPAGSLDEAAQVAPRLGGRILLTVGRQGIGPFLGCRAVLDSGAAVVARMIEPPEAPVPAAITVLLARGPFTVEQETALLDAHRIDVLVSKNSGGPMTAAKLVAARLRQLPVVMVRRPALPVGVPVVEEVDAALRWVDAAAT